MYSDFAIINEMIFNFLYSRINSLLGWSEDHQFRGYEDIEKGNEIIRIENDESYL